MRQNLKYDRNILQHTVDWNLFETKYFSDFFANIQNRNNTIAKNFNGYIVIIVVMNFHKKF